MIESMPAVEKIIKKSLQEDLGFGDITTNSIFTNEKTSGFLQAKEKGVIAGLSVAEKVWKSVDSSLFFEAFFCDGNEVNKGDKIALVKGSTRSILVGERTALNFLQRMSGIAALTAKFVSQTKNTSAQIVDTRKTTPGLRIIEKYAVRIGGGKNHRFSLDHAVLIKDNHITACGSITKAVKKVRNHVPIVSIIEVETQNIFQVEEALYAGADIIMLDNMNTENIKEAVDFVSGKALVEASGSITLDRVREIAQTGVDFISVGELTHSPTALDISFSLI